jgi:L-arabinose isomerase
MRAAVGARSADLKVMRFGDNNAQCGRYRRRLGEVQAKLGWQ